MEQININQNQEVSLDSSTAKTRKIVYKGKEKEIPICNPEKNLCEFWIVARMRYCKFEKLPGVDFCIYHLEDEKMFINCPIDPSHRVLASKLKKHVKVCNKLGEKKRLIANEWYDEKVNTIKENEEIIKENVTLNGGVFTTLDALYEVKWEEISEEEYSNMLDKIINSYETLKADYKAYVEKENLQEIINEKMLNGMKIKDDDISQLQLSISALEINMDKDLQFTKGLAKSEKNGKQNFAISSVIEAFGILDSKNLFIEFGAGKAGLSHHISTVTKDNSVHILLEREGVRYKKDKYSDKMIRFRTDILDFNINYIDHYFKENKDKHKLKLINKEGKEEEVSVSEVNYGLLGIAKHICGCAFDMSLKCLLNYHDRNRIKGTTIATCCHHICRVEYLNNLKFYMDYLKLSVREIILLFKATSWIFGPIETHDEVVNNVKSNKIFLNKGIKKNYIGLIAKYVVDLARVFFLIDQKFKVFYLKYCDNEITTENNLILAL